MPYMIDFLRAGDSNGDAIVVKYGDTLSDIALQVYGDGTEPCWRTIYEANKDTIKNPDLIYPGQVLKIPAS